MKRTMLAAGSFAAVVLAGAWFTSVSKAITMVEMPAWVFPEVTVQGSQVPMLCVNNMGDGSVRALIGLLDVADSSRALSAPVPVSFAAHQGTCMNMAVGRPVTSVAPAQTSAIAAVWVLGANESGGGGGAGKSLVASLQVRDEGGTRFALTPTYMNQIAIPATSVLP